MGETVRALARHCMVAKTKDGGERGSLLKPKPFFLRSIIQNKMLEDVKKRLYRHWLTN